MTGDVLCQVTFCGVTFCGVTFCGVTFCRGDVLCQVMFCGVTFCRGTNLRGRIRYTMIRTCSHDQKGIKRLLLIALYVLDVGKLGLVDLPHLPEQNFAHWVERIFALKKV